MSEGRVKMYEDDTRVKITPIDEAVPLVMPSPEKMDWYNRTRKLDANDLVVKLGYEGFRKWVFEQLDKAPVVYRRDTEVVSLWEMRTNFRELREPVVEGLLRKGEILNIVAPPKYGKSLLITTLTICIAQGREWLDTFRCRQGKVLIVDNELHRETLAHRIQEVATSMDVPIEYLDQWIDYLPLRGRLVDIDGLKEKFEDIGLGEYRLVVLDALYKFMPKKTDENNNGEMAVIFNKLDQYAKHLDCAIALIHHTSKGEQGYKSVTDVGAGAGVQSRASDTHLILREHREPAVASIAAVARSFKAPKPFCARFRYPKWILAPECNPDDLKLTAQEERLEERRSGKEQAAKIENEKLDRLLRAVTTPMTIDEMTTLASGMGVSGFSKYKMRRQVDVWVGSGLIKLAVPAAGRVGAKFTNTDQKTITNTPNVSNEKVKTVTEETQATDDSTTNVPSIPF
jgi:RecA-family ATPase